MVEPLTACPTDEELAEAKAEMERTADAWLRRLAADAARPQTPEQRVAFNEMGSARLRYEQMARTMAEHG